MARLALPLVAPPFAPVLGLLLLAAGCGPAGVKLPGDTGLLVDTASDNGGGDSEDSDSSADNGDNGDNGGNGDNADNGSNGDNGGNGDTTDNGGDNGDNADNGGDSGDSGGDTGGDTGSDGPVFDGGTGPYSVSSLDDEVDGNDVTYYVPNDGAPWPVVIWSHGFTRSKENHVAAATRLASWGVLVMTPNLPSTWDHAENGQVIAEEFLPSARSTFGSQVTDHAALVGHSAGGLASLVAASLTAVDGVVELDGVDYGDLGEVAAPLVSEPTLFLVGQSSVCNDSGSGTDWVGEVSGPEWRVDVADACHCDFESDTDWVCTTLCGANETGRQDTVQAYADAWVLHHTVGGAEDWLEGGAVAVADRSAGRISW